MTRKLVIVQARMGSTRLPGKVLKPLGRSGTVLAEVLRRCAAIPGIDGVVCATSDLPEDDVIAAEARRHGALIHRGSASDVLARYLGAAIEHAADIVMRVTSDCPLIDPVVCGAVLAQVEAGADYACNNLPPSWPHGLDCEAFTRRALERAAAEGIEAGDREHVTPFIRRTADFVRVNVPMLDDQDLHLLRWTLDYPEDYAFFCAVFALLPPPPSMPGWEEVGSLLDARPELVYINANRVQR